MSQNELFEDLINSHKLFFLTLGLMVFNLIEKPQKNIRA